MGPLDDLWSDDDRRDAGLERILLAHAGVRHYNGVNFQRHDRDSSLTTRELDVLRAASHGLQWQETAEHLGIRPFTVQKTMTHARRKLAAKTVAQAVAEALRQGLIP